MIHLQFNNFYCSFKHIVYKFHCNFCNEIHKHNSIGHNDCRCMSMYSPYSRSGYNLELDLKFQILMNIYYII